MSTVTREQVIAYLVNCPPGEFIQILAPTLHAHRDDGGAKRRLALCQLTRANPAPKDASAWTDLEIIAATPPTENVSHLEGNGYWESGRCQQCRMDILSYAKTAVCPLCGSIVELT